MTDVREKIFGAENGPRSNVTSSANHGVFA
jgi:hypothetical protein